jgi:hypothetical protein
MVVLPHPEGPIMAVMRFCAIASETPSTASNEPYVTPTSSSSKTISSVSGSGTRTAPASSAREGGRVRFSSTF